MSDNLKRTIEDLQVEIQNKENEIIEEKRLVNRLCAKAGIPIAYADTEAQQSATETIRRDQFYGRPLATAVKEILGRRKVKDQGAATVEEILEVLMAGGFEFEPGVKDQKRALGISLGKNPAFHRVREGLYGLSDWYAVKREKRSRGGSKQEDDGGDPGAEPEEGDDEVGPDRAGPRLNTA